MNFLVRHHFSDFDSLANFTRSWDLDFRQLDHGLFGATLLQYGVDHSQIGIVKLNRKFDQRGMSPKDLFSFALLNDDSPPILWRGVEVDHQKLMVYDPGIEIDCVSEPGFNVTTYSVSPELLEMVGKELGIPQQEKHLKQKKVIPISTVRRNILFEAIGRTHRLVGPRGDGLKRTITKKLLQFEIPALFLKSIVETQNIKIKSVFNQRRNTICEIIDQTLKVSPQEPRTVKELCRLTQVSERTIQYLFQKKFGISPKAYLKRIRLNGVRKTLYAADPGETRISDIADDWGFWHMGQFAKDYKELFGELPSTTSNKI